MVRKMNCKWGYMGYCANASTAQKARATLAKYSSYQWEISGVVGAVVPFGPWSPGVDANGSTILELKHVIRSPTHPECPIQSESPLETRRFGLGVNSSRCVVNFWCPPIRKMVYRKMLGRFSDFVLHL